MKKRNNKKKGSQSNFSKLSVFQNNKYKFKKKCPLAGKGAPVVDYKNIKWLRHYKILFKIRLFTILNKNWGKKCIIILFLPEELLWLLFEFARQNVDLSQP